MVLYIAAIAVIALAGIKFSFKKGFEDYMSPKDTGAVKGLFVIIVFFSHIRQYCTVAPDELNKPYLDVMSWFGQLMVVMFLFYSGYGVFLAIKNKDGYVKTMPLKRILKVWYHFALAVLLYLALGRAMGKNYTWEMYRDAIIGIGGLGNSSWFIMVILLLYLATFIAFIFIGRKHMLVGTILTTALGFGVLIWLMNVKADDYWWYDTLMCYPLGMWYALAKPKIDKSLLNDFGKWFSASAITAVIFFIMKYYLMPLHTSSRNFFMIEALVFGILITLLSMRIKIGNSVLRWFGKRIMGIYILQRIPMIYFASIGLNAYPKIFTLCCLTATLIIAELFDLATGGLDILFHLSPKKKKKSKDLLKNQEK